MLTINEEQITLMQEYSYEALRQDILRDVLINKRIVDVNENNLLGIIDSMVKKADVYGIRSKKQVTRFISIFLGKDLERNLSGGIGVTLSDDALLPWQKLDKVEDIILASHCVEEGVFKSER